MADYENPYWTQGSTVQPGYEEPGLLDNPLINNFATRGLLSGVQFISSTLSKPKNAIFGLLDGDVSQLANLIPFSDTLGITNTGDPEKGLTVKPVEGRDLLRRYGMADSEDTWGNFAGGLALDIALDPLSWVRGPMGALTKAGEAAQKSVGLERSIIGRMKPPVPLTPQGGLFSITNKPWYMEMLPGAKPAENLFVAGVDDFGKKAFQGIAQGMDDGWSKATRYTLPGTDFSPVAWMRSAYEKGAGNITGYAPIVDEQAKTLVRDTKAFQSAGREAAFPIQELQASTIDKLEPIIGDRNAAEILMNRAAVSRRDKVAMKLPDDTPPEAIKILNEWSDNASRHMEPIYGKESLADARAHGVQINEASNIWDHGYHHRQQAGMGDSFGSQQMGREQILAELPGGTAQAERIATSPFSGAYSRERDPVKRAALKEEFKAYLHKEIMDEGNAQISQNWPRYRSLGNRGSTPSPTLAMSPGQLIDTPRERVLKELERSFGLTPKDTFSPDTVVKARAKGWGGDHKFTPANLANATPEDIAWMRDRKAAERALEIVSNPKERDKLADRLADYFLDVDPEIAKRGYFYHQDVGTAAASYAEHIGAQKAMNISVMNVLSKEADLTETLSKAVTKSGDMYTLKEAVEELGMQGAEDMLLKKVKTSRDALSTIEDLDSVAVPKKLVENLKLEKEGAKQAPEGWIAKLTNATRYGLTVLWPANLFRNVTGETANIAASGTNPLKGLADSVSFFNKTLTDPERLAKAQSVYKSGIIHGGLGFDQNRQLIGTGVTKSGGLAVDVAPKQAARSKLDIIKDWAKPIYSETAREELGITKFRDLFKPAQQAKSASDAVQAAGTVPTPLSPVAKVSKKELYRQGLDEAKEISRDTWVEAFQGTQGFTKESMDTVAHSYLGMFERMAEKAGVPIKKSPINILLDHARPEYGNKQQWLAAAKTHNKGIKKSVQDFVEDLAAHKSSGEAIDISDYLAPMMQDVGEAVRQGGWDVRGSYNLSHSPDIAQPVKSAVDAVSPAGTVSPPTSVKQWLVDQVGKVIDPLRGYAGAMESAQHFQNNVSRHQQAARLIEEGFSPSAAWDRVLTTQRDYTNLTPFENRFMRNVTPFYSFAKQNLRTQADLLSREPGRYNAILSLLNSGRESGGFVPGYASSGTAIPLPGAPEGQQRFLGSLGLTQEDEMMSALSSFAGFRPDEGIRKLASASNPALKFLYERATGTQVFSGRKLDDLKPGVIPSLLTGGNDPAARFLSSLASGTPAARVFSTVDRASDIERRGVFNTLLNLGTGIRTIDVDQQAAAQIAARDTITKLLNASDQFKLRDQLVVDAKWKDRGEEMPPEIAELFRQYQWLQREGKAAVKEKQMAAGR